LFWGNLAFLRWFTKRTGMGELRIDCFLGFGRDSTWVHWGGGTISVLRNVLGEIAYLWMGFRVDVLGFVRTIKST
jgi:hypothetical protein